MKVEIVHGFDLIEFIIDLLPDHGAVVLMLVDCVNNVGHVFPVGFDKRDTFIRVFLMLDDLGAFLDLTLYSGCGFGDAYLLLDGLELLWYDISD